MRVIIRFSLNRDPGSALRNALKAVLESQDIIWTGRSTATYEGYVSEAKIRRALSLFWRTAANHPVATTKVDHFWMYADRQRRPTVEP